MRIAIGSIFRNSTSYLDRYFGQLGRLCNRLCADGHSIHMILVEGDSTDGTWDALIKHADALSSLNYTMQPGSDTTWFQASHGGPVFGSVDDETRWRNISFVCNKLLGAVSSHDDRLIYVESDLIWEVSTMQLLLDDLMVNPLIDAVAPLCIHQPTGMNYETWGHRKDGVRFGPKPPYHPAISDALVPIDSAGSCLVMRGTVARSARFQPMELGIVGFGNDMRAKGYSLWLDPQQIVYHP